MAEYILKEDEIRKEEVIALDEAIKKAKRAELPKILRVQQTILKAVDEYMYEKGITRMMPLMMAPITDTLNHSVEETSISYCGQKFDVMKSMIFHKQITLMNEGLEKIYIVSPNIRLERPERNDKRHLFEFTQVDFEFKDAHMDDIFKFMEELLTYVFSVVKEKCKDELEKLGVGTKHLDIVGPFERYRTEDLKEKYGDDFEAEASKKAVKPFWLINHKREFYDAEDLEKKGTYKNYDLIWPYGIGEGLSGGEREYKYDRIIERMEEIGADKKVFRNYIELAKRGEIPKTAGAGFGVERITRFVCMLGEISEATVFSRKPGEAPYIF